MHGCVACVHLCAIPARPRNIRSLGTVFTGLDYLPSCLWHWTLSSFSSQSSSLACCLSTCDFIEKLFDFLIKLYLVIPCYLSMPSPLLPFQDIHFKSVCFRKYVQIWEYNTLIAFLLVGCIWSRDEHLDELLHWISNLKALSASG